MTPPVVPMVCITRGVRTTKSVAIDDTTAEELNALHAALGISRRRIVREAIAGYSVLLDLSTTARRK